MRGSRKPKTAVAAGAAPVTAPMPVSVPTGKVVKLTDLAVWAQKSYKGLSGDKHAATRQAIADAANVCNALKRITAFTNKSDCPDAPFVLIAQIATKRGWAQIVNGETVLYSRKEVQ